MSNNKQSQALAVMAKVFEASQFPVESFQKGIKGTLGEGGKVWTIAQALYPASAWTDVFAQVTFEDGSAIEFIRHANSLFATTYRAVMPLEAPQASQETRSDLELASMLLDEFKDYWTTRDGRLLVNFQDKGVWRMMPNGETWEERESLVLMPTGSQVIQYATAAQAYEWLHSTLDDKYCHKCLGISANHPDAAKLVYDLERAFQKLLKEGDD